MTNISVHAQQLLAAFALPATTLVQKRIPKKMLAEHSATALADRKLIHDVLEEVTWHAALKPSNVGVAAYEDAERSYLEIAVIFARLRTAQAESAVPSRAPHSTISSHGRRIAECIHRAIPYPVVLVLEESTHLYASMAHIRKAQREAEKMVLDGKHIIASSEGPEHWDSFLQAIALNKQPTQHLYALYQGWMDLLSAWQAVELTGTFRVSDSPEQAAQRRAALHACQDLDVRIAAARKAAAKEKQLARQVAANLEIKALLAQRQQIAQDL